LIALTMEKAAAKLRTGRPTGDELDYGLAC
jgi:hypothetical protein